MKRALTYASAALLLVLGPVGCGDDDPDPAVETTPVVSASPSASEADDAEALSADETACKDEIVRQMTDPTQETDDTPPECEGVSDSRILKLASIADGEVKKDE